MTFSSIFLLLRLVAQVKVRALDFIAVIDEKNYKPRSCTGTDLLDFKSPGIQKYSADRSPVRGAEAVDESGEDRAVD